MRAFPARNCSSSSCAVASDAKTRCGMRSQTMRSFCIATQKLTCCESGSSQTPSLSSEPGVDRAIVTHAGGSADSQQILNVCVFTTLSVSGE